MMSRVVQRLVWGLIVFASGLSADDAQADPRVRFGIGFGNGVRVGISNGPMYGPGYYGHPHGPYGYGPPPIVIAPRPVYVPPPIYVQPQPVYVPPPPQILSAPTAIPSAPTPIADGGEILLFSPMTNTADVRYTLNGNAFTMRPGTKQRFKNDRAWTIQFESAPGQMTSYTLESSQYKFQSHGGTIALAQTVESPESAPPSLRLAPIPHPPEASGEPTVIPSRPVLRTTP